MSGETTALLVRMLNHEGTGVRSSAEEITEAQVSLTLDELYSRGLVVGEWGYAPDVPGKEAFWWEVTAEGLALVESLEDPEEQMRGEHGSMLPKIETRRLRLRQWRDEDLNDYARICADPEVMRYMGGPRTRERCREQLGWFARHWEEHGFGHWAVEDKISGAFIGRIGLLYHEDWPVGEHKTEIGWLLDRAYWGRGLATEGARANLVYGFERRKLERIISITLPENTASRRVMEKCGLILQGEARWKGSDVVWHAIDRPDWKAKTKADC